MISTSSASELADIDKTNFFAAFFHHIDIIFCIISIWVFFENSLYSITGVAITLLILERLALFFYTGIKTYKWSQAIMALVFLDYFGEMCKQEEGRGIRLFKKMYTRVFMISSPFSIFCFFAFFEGANHRALVLVCGFIHLLNTAQTNLEYYSQNILTIQTKQRIYIYTFILCEYFYRLVFLSFFKQMIGSGGMVGYQIGEFFINFFLEFFICRREGQEKSYWVFSTFQKAWSGAFYFRLEDTMVQDADEWTSDSRNMNNYRQQLRVDNVFKSSRSKVFICFRFLENVFLTIVGIAQFADHKEQDALFALAIILLPFYLVWHFKYSCFKFAAQPQTRTNRNLNDSANEVPVESAANKYKDENKMKQLNSEQSQNNGVHSTPVQNKYINNQNVFNQYPSENTYGSEQKNLKKQEQNEFNHIDQTPPAAEQKHQSQASRSLFNQNIDIEIGQLNGKQKSQEQEKQYPAPKKFNSHNSEQLRKNESKGTHNLKDKQDDYEENDSYGKADINAFAIE